MKPAITKVRIDKWLWATRLYKHRASATRACTAGHVKIEGQNIKPSKPVVIGQFIEALTPGGLRVVEVQALSDKRRSASEAEKLYIDHTPPPEPKDPWEVVEARAGRPRPRDRRELKRLKGKLW